MSLKIKAETKARIKVKTKGRNSLKNFLRNPTCSVYTNHRSIC